MASVDIKDAYYTIPVHEKHRKYLSSYGMENFTNLLACQMACLVALGSLQKF